MSYQIIAEKPIGEVITDQGAYMQMKLMHIVCDTISQIPEPLPAWATGSRCDVTADGGAVYMLNNARNWEKVNFFGNAGGDSGTTDYSELTNKPQINGVTLSGNKTAVDLNLETDLSDYYTKQQTDSRITEKVAEIVADAPEDFDTLKEISDWISHHEDSAAAMNTAIQQNTTAIAGKVDKVAGKGLSTNDYTTAEKTKLAGLTVSKNLIPTVINSPLTQDGITLTLNSDYSINANGTATNTTRVYTGERTLPAGRYELNGCPYTKNSNYSVELYRYDTENEQWVLYYDDPASIIRNGSSFIFTAEIETKVRTAICFNQGCTVSDVTFQIMIRDYDAYMLDDNYEPYAPSNFELYSLIGNINNVLEGVL